MKISQMTNDQAADTLVRITEPISHIVADEEALPMLQELFVESRSENPMEGWAAVLMRFVPFCLKKHRADFYKIIAALDGKDDSDIGKANFMSTLRVLRDSMDKELLDFFKSSAAATQSGEKKSAR